MTNGDKIRTMTTDELVEFVYKLMACDSCIFFNKCCISKLDYKNFLKEWILEEAIE